VDEFADVENLHRSIGDVVAKNAASIDEPSECGLFDRVAGHRVTPRGNRRAYRYVGCTSGCARHARRHAFNLIELLTREWTGAETQWIGGLSPSPFPVWLKLARSGRPSLPPRSTPQPLGRSRPGWCFASR
jgi:hypothetical protein